ncbi:MAG: FAD-dependent oxidoreductase [Spirochaetes bacterium]|nr:FAD-dependent oxidoreductase [Spirochaetota bacterium]
MNINLNISSFVNEPNFNSISPDKIYDTLIIGGGPAGLTAAVYCMRKGMKTALVLKKAGGQVAETASIENYPGYSYIDGNDLTLKFREQVMQFGIDYAENVSAERIIQGNVKKTLLDNGSAVSSKSIIIATGKKWKKLNIPGEERLINRGVAYCSICDGPLFAGKKVAVAGGGNSGVQAAIDLAKIASVVYLIQHRDRLKADEILVNSLKKFSNVEYLLGHEIREIHGEKEVEKITVENLSGNSSFEIPLNGVFVEIGMIPNTGFLNDVLKLNAFNEIPVDHLCRTEAAGVFAAGDVTDVRYKQIIVAAGEGAKAALSAYDYINFEFV